MSVEGPCTCWVKVALHENHCCFRDLPDDMPEGGPVPCGHDDAGMAIYAATKETSWAS